ncbi:MAG: hypothetical protein HUK02_01360 [Bacteroidaceae bacterium]|nr:hypothetical protein [Bacteroidaceae bacterium]
MKRTLRILLLAVAGEASAQEHLQMLADGRTWDCEVWSFADLVSMEPRGTATWEVRGDTIVDGLAGKIMQLKHAECSDAPQYPMREDNGKVWFACAGQWYLGYDFSLAQGETEEIFYCETFGLEGPVTVEVKDVQYEKMQGIKRKVMHMQLVSDANHEPVPFTWIQGIGMCDIPIYNLPSSLSGYGGSVLVRCSQDDCCLYVVSDDDEYRNTRLLRTGRTWEVTADDYVQTWAVTGDTQVEGNQCYWVEFADMRYLMREDGDKVWWSDNEGADWALAYDFSLEHGDAIVLCPIGRKETSYRITVLKTHTQYFCWCGAKRKVLWVRATAENDGRSNDYFWIQGIGSTRGVVKNSTLNDETHCCLSRCAQNGYGLFDKDYLGVINYAPVVSPSGMAPLSSTLYDLTGRRLPKVPQHGLYIRDGRVLAN